MASVREQILARIQTALLAANIAGVATNVFRSRENAISRENAPAIVVMPKAEAIERVAQAVDRHRLTAGLEIFVRGDPYDNLADPIAVAMHVVLMTDVTLQTLVVKIELKSAEWTAEEADRTAGLLSSEYLFTYLVPANDITGAINS